MFARLKKGQVLKSKDSKTGKISYTVILQSKPFFLELYKTVKLSKNWEDDFSPIEFRVRKYDFTNYTNRIINEKLKLVDNEEEVIRLRENMHNLPEKIQEKIYGGEKIEIFHTNHNNSLYGAEIQKISNIDSNINSGNLECLSKKLSDNIKYKRKLSIS